MTTDVLVPATVHLATPAVYLIAAVPLAIAVTVATIVWRSARRERSARSLRQQLEDEDPRVRRDALDDVTDTVLSTHAPLLCELLDRERDPDVLDALAAAIARSKWEPTDDPYLVRLRRWVAGGQTRATRSSPAGADGVAVEPDGQADPEPQVAGPLEPATPDTAWSGVTAAEPAGAEEVDELVGRVREVLGAVERVELVSMDGELVTSWSSGHEPGRGPDREGADA